MKQGSASALQEAQKKMLLSSNITNGAYGTIFKDSQGNIWVMSAGHRLEIVQTNKPPGAKKGRTSSMSGATIAWLAIGISAAVAIIGVLSLLWIRKTRKSNK